MAIFSDILISILPSKVKIFLMRKLGAKIGKNCELGYLAIINSKKIILGDNVQISAFNLIHRLNLFQVKPFSKIGSFNWITGANQGEFCLGKNSAITRFHFFESSGGVLIGDNSIIAGRDSHFFTHGLKEDNLDDIQKITIGSWCYVGSSSKFVPGSSIEDGTFVGMGAVVTKNFSRKYILIAGNPAVIKKDLNNNSTYFNRKFINHFN